MIKHPLDSPFLEAIDNKIQSAENSAQYKTMFGYSRKFDREKDVRNFAQMSLVFMLCTLST